MNQSQNLLRSRNTSSYSTVGQGSLAQIQLIQTLETDRVEGSRKADNLRFVPFLKERDSMNRLVAYGNLESPDKLLTKQKIKKQPESTNNVGNEKWKQNDPMRMISPLKRTQVNEVKLIKQRSQSNAEYRNRMLQAYTERHQQVFQNDESIQQQYNLDIDDHQNSTYKFAITKQDETIKSPIKLQKQMVRQESLGERELKIKKLPVYLEQDYTLREKEHQQKYNNPNQIIKTQDIKLPLLKQKQYVKEFIESNNQLRDLMQQQKNQEKHYQFPPDFELKLIQMKRNIKVMKAKYKNWNNGADQEENIRYLKEAAQIIINKK